MRLLLTATIVAAMSWSATAQPRAPASGLTAQVGPGFTIAMSAKSVRRGNYTIIVRDRSPIHNFHLIGPGLNRSTSISASRTTIWHVTLRRGTYRFNCYAHPSIMHGMLRVT